jgi:hypothetical protein
VNLRSGFDEVLEMCSGEEVSKIDEFAVVLVLDVDNTPSVLTSTDLLSSNNNGLLGTDNGEWNDVLHRILAWDPQGAFTSHTLI